MIANKRTLIWMWTCLAAGILLLFAVSCSEDGDGNSSIYVGGGILCVDTPLFALCTSARCEPDSSDSNYLICHCDVESGANFGKTTCEERMPQTTELYTELRSDFSPIQAGSPSNLKALVCENEPMWASCLDYAEFKKNTLSCSYLGVESESQPANSPANLGMSPIGTMPRFAGDPQRVTNISTVSQIRFRNRNGPKNKRPEAQGAHGIRTATPVHLVVEPLQTVNPKVKVTYIKVEFQSLLRKSGLHLPALHNAGGCAMLGSCT